MSELRLLLLQPDVLQRKRWEALRHSSFLQADSCILSKDRGGASPSEPQRRPGLHTQNRRAGDVQEVRLLRKRLLGLSPVSKNEEQEQFVL